MSTKPSHAAPRGLSRRVWSLLVSLVFVAGALLLGTARWIAAHFGIITIDQVVINLRGAGGEGAGGTALVVGGIVAAVIVPIALAILVLLAIRRTQRSDWKRALPRLARVGVTTAIVGVLVAVPVAGARAISTTLSLPQYVESLRSDQRLEDFYTAPAVIGSPEGTPRNLVMIYMESVEDSLADTSIFEKDMLAPVTDVTEGWESVRMTQPANGGWTLGGIVNTQCGFPLRMADTSLVGNAINVAGKDVEDYLPGATCLGDVLAGAGYRSVFMGGANTSFAGKDAFLASHGYETVLGRADWQARGETEFRDDWGLSDRRLMELAADKVTELHDAGQPFNLTVLTLDTHPDDYLHPYCDVSTQQELTSIYDCSMQQVAGFVQHMKERGYLDDTVVIVMGDHLRIAGANNTFLDQLEAIPDRTIFNRIWSPDGVAFEVDEIDQFSMYPTILETLGYELADGRAGIGVSALNGNPSPGTIRGLPGGVVDSLVLSQSQEFYDRVWGVEP